MGTFCPPSVLPLSDAQYGAIISGVSGGLELGRSSSKTACDRAPRVLSVSESATACLCFGGSFWFEQSCGLSEPCFPMRTPLLHSSESFVFTHSRTFGKRGCILLDFWAQFSLCWGKNSFVCMCCCSSERGYCAPTPKNWRPDIVYHRTFIIFPLNS